MASSNELDRVIGALHAVKRRVDELESRRPLVDPHDVAASKDDLDPFVRIFGRERGRYWEKEISRIRESVEQISAELGRLQP